MLPSIPAAFELKTQAVYLAGVDLPALLPAAAALPPVVQLLPGLAEDMAAAKDEAAAALLRGDTQRQGVCLWHGFGHLLHRVQIVWYDRCSRSSLLRFANAFPVNS